MISTPRTTPPWAARSSRPQLSVYEFVTTFEIGALPSAVFDAVVEPEPWLTRWDDAVEIDRIRSALPDGTDGSIAGSVRAPLGYRITGRLDVTSADRPERVEMEVTGTIKGSAVWQLRPTCDGTSVHVAMTVRPVVTWLRIITPLARPLLEAAHATVVRNAVDAAASHLNAPVHSFSSRAGRSKEELD